MGTAGDPRAGYLSDVRAWGVRHAPHPAAVVSHLAEVLGADRGAPGLGRRLGQLVASDVGPTPMDDLPIPPPSLAGPEVLGEVYEVLLDPRGRRAQGVFFTPPDLAKRLVEVALDGLTIAIDRLRICDPAAGGGAFLLAAARVLCERGLSPSDLVTKALWGADIDPVAAEVTRVSLALWSLERGDLVWPGETIVAGDTLLEGLDVWEGGAAAFDLVVGNPPFQNQLGRDTARQGRRAELIRERYGSVARGYADTASVFLAAGCGLAGAGGRVCMIQPQSFLVAMHSIDARRAVLEAGWLEALWVARTLVFAANVRVCAPVIEIGGSPRPIRRFVGSEVEPIESIFIDEDDLREASTWGRVAAGALGFPLAEITGTGSLAELCHATAGFRDQYYGLADHVREAGAVGFEIGATPIRHAPLITSGLIDSAVCYWSNLDVRFAKQRWKAPVVDLHTLAQENQPLWQWIDDRLRPKVLVATQSRVVEVIVDIEGRLVPSVPVISVEADVDELWRVAAVLSAPPITALALERYGGAALSLDAVKLSAKQILELPLPVDDGAWAKGAAALEAASGAADEQGWRHELEASGAAMCDAYELRDHDDMVQWWLDRVPSWRGPRWWY